MSPLGVGLIVHTAPRDLRAGKCFGKTIWPLGVSILAGCTQANSWARAVTHDLLHQILAAAANISLPPAPPDDALPCVVLEYYGEAGALIQGCLAELGLIVEQGRMT